MSRAGTREAALRASQGGARHDRLRGGQPSPLRPRRRDGRRRSAARFPRAGYVVQRDESEAPTATSCGCGDHGGDQLDPCVAPASWRRCRARSSWCRASACSRPVGIPADRRRCCSVTRGEGRDEDPGDRAIFWGDLIPTRWQIPVRWTSAFDDYPIQAVEIRNELVTRAAAEGWWCYFTHDPGDLPIQIERTPRRGAIGRAGHSGLPFRPRYQPHPSPHPGCRFPGGGIFRVVRPCRRASPRPRFSA